MSRIRRTLVARRKALGWSQARVSDQAPRVRGLSREVIVRWEQLDSSRTPSDVQLEAWAAALGLRLLLVEDCPTADQVEILSADEVRVVLDHRRLRHAEAA